MHTLTQTSQPEPSFHDDGGETGGEVCIANISPRERRKRLMSGVVELVIAIPILAWLLAIHADRLWRLPLFLLFGAAAAGYFQWRDKT